MIAPSRTHVLLAASVGVALNISFFVVRGSVEPSLASLLFIGWFLTPYFAAAALLLMTRAVWPVLGACVATLLYDLWATLIQLAPGQSTGTLMLWTMKPIFSVLFCFPIGAGLGWLAGRLMCRRAP